MGCLNCLLVHSYLGRHVKILARYSHLFCLHSRFLLTFLASCWVWKNNYFRSLINIIFSEEKRWRKQHKIRINICYFRLHHEILFSRVSCCPRAPQPWLKSTIWSSNWFPIHLILSNLERWLINLAEDLKWTTFNTIPKRLLFNTHGMFWYDFIILEVETAHFRTNL